MKSLLLALCALSASAAPMTIVYSGSGSGTLNGVAFALTPFTITALADTANISTNGAGLFFVNHSSAQVNISGVALVNITSLNTTFVDQPNARIGLSEPSVLMRAGDPSTAAYDLSTSFLLNDSFNLLQWGTQNVVTTGGQLIFNDGTTSGSISITVNGIPPGGGVPEPSTWMLAGLPLAWVIARRVRR